MKARLQVSKAAIDLIKGFEGYRPSSARLPDGRWTIGYGHTLTAREGAEVDRNDAEALLIYDLLQVTLVMGDVIYAPLNQNQYDALACFAFSVGPERFRNSHVLRLINQGDFLQAAYAIEAWRKSDLEGEEVVVDALIRRRAAEKALFLTPTRGPIVVPSAVVPPLLDEEAVFANAVRLEAPLEGEAAFARRASPFDEAQDFLPMDYPPARSLPAEPEPEPEAPEAEAAPEAPLQDKLFDIPGYSPEPAAAPGFRPMANISIAQLVVVGLGGLILLLIAFVMAMRGSNAVALGAITDYAIAAVAGLLGAAGVFAAVYMVLNRLESDS